MAMCGLLVKMKGFIYYSPPKGEGKDVATTAGYPILSTCFTQQIRQDKSSIDTWIISQTPAGQFDKSCTSSLYLVQ